MSNESLTDADTQAVWDFMVAAAPGLAAHPDQLKSEGFLSAVVLSAMQARLALTMRLGSEYTPVRKGWLDAVTDLSHSARQLVQASGAVQAAQVPAGLGCTPVRTGAQALEASALGEAAAAAIPASARRPA